MSSIGFRMGFTGRAVLAGGVLGMGFVAGAAQATVYNWTYQETESGNWSASGQFEETGGVISSFSGTWNGVNIAGLLPIGGFDGNDNKYPLTNLGVAFSLQDPLADGSLAVRLYDNGIVNWYGDEWDLYDYGSGSFTATPVGVPEPASAALLGTAVAGLLAGARRRRAKAAAAA